MEKYSIQPYHIRPQTREITANESGFSLILLTIEEWNQLPRILTPESGEMEGIKHWVEDHQPAVNKVKGIIPHLAHLAPKVHFMTFCDIDQQGKESGITMFILPKSFILIKTKNEFLSLIERWATRGILTNPLDLAYLLGLHILDNFQQRLDSFDNDLFQLEKDILQGPKVTHQKDILNYHKSIITIRKSINLHQSVFEHMSDLSNTETNLEKDLLSTTTQIIANIQNSHEQVENLREAYQTAVQNSTNDIMKFLTIIATTLLPINLMTSFFGMNFENLPLINVPYGILTFYIISVLLVALIVGYFWQHKWLRFWHRLKNKV